MHIIRKLGLSAAILLCASAINAADVLPVTVIDGKKYYEYLVPKGETVYAITRHFGISRAEFIEANPTVTSGLKAGSVVLIPAASVKEGRVVEQPVVKVTESDFTHLVQKGETLYGISKKYDTTVEKLIELNFWAEKGIKTGQVLRIPMSGDAMMDEEALQDAPDPFALEPTTLPDSVPEAEPELLPSDDFTAESEPSDSLSESRDVEMALPDPDRTYEIAVLLPFNTSRSDAHSQTYLNFFKGMLLAADSLGKADGNRVTISAYDTEGSIDKVNRLMMSTEVTDADVIVAPDSVSHMLKIAEAADSLDFYVFNIFNIQDESHLTHPNLIQANVSHEYMYDNAILAMAEMYPDHILVTLESENGKNDKEKFVTDARRRYRLASKPVIEMTYGALLEPSALDTLSKDNKYIFLPSSGSLSEFNKIQGAILTLKQNATYPENVKLFGYPEWTAFRLDRLDRLHELDATIYSRFYDTTVENESPVAEAYKRWYGEEIRDMVPKYELLGFDVASYLIEALRANGGDFSSENNPEYIGVQSAFNIEPGADENEGPSNEALYIITYNPDKTVTKTVK